VGGEKLNFHVLIGTGVGMKKVGDNSSIPACQKQTATLQLMKIREAASSMSLTPVNSLALHVRRITDRQQFSFISVTIHFDVKIICMMPSSLSQLNILN